MNRENKFLLLNTLILLVVGLLVILVYSSLAVTSKADKIFGTKVKLELVEDDNLPSNIKEVNNVYKGSLKVGQLFDVFERNSFGELSLLVGIDTDNNIVGIYQLITQNYPQEHHQEQVYLYIDSLIGSNISNPTNLDGVTKPTTVVTLGTVESMLNAIASYLTDDIEPEEPKSEIEFIEVTEKGRKYKVSKEATYVGASKGLLSFNVIIDEDKKLVSYEELEYKHSGDNFKETALNFFDSLIGRDITTLNESELDGSTGATNSRTTILDLLMDLAEFIEGDE